MGEWYFMKIVGMNNPSDIEQFLETYAEAIGDPAVVQKIQALFSHASCDGYLAMEGDTVISVALYSRENSSIIGCLVPPAFEGRNIEKELIGKVFWELRGRGAHQIQGAFLMNHPGVHISIREELQSLGFITAEELEMALSLPHIGVPQYTLPPDYSLIPYSPSYKDFMITIKYEGNRGTTGNPLVHGVSSREETEHEVEKTLSGRFGAFLPTASIMLLQGEKAVGCTTCIRRPDGVGILTNVTILPEYRQRGLGKALVIESLHRLHRLDVSRVQLSVVASNDSAMKIYCDLGFEEIARVCYYRWVDTL